MAITRQQAAAEMLRRRQARKSLIAFTRYTYPKYRPSEHHHKIADRLEAVEQGDIKRLMIRMPPRHGKSELASRRFPAWCMGRDFDKNLISASYNSELAGDFGREVRNIIDSRKFNNVFPNVTLAKDSAAAGRWHTNGLGGYVAAGIGTAVTGRGANIFTIDDPVKDREDADSDRSRERTYKWYTSTAYTRLENSIDEEFSDEDWLWDIGGALRSQIIKPFEGAIILIQTPWHDDDLSGRLINDMENGADQWEIIDLPSWEYVSGKRVALWESKFNLDRLDEIRKAIGERDFQSLYQLDPTPEEGAHYKREWFKRYDPHEKPELLNLYATSDYAVSEDDGDFTEHSIWGISSDDDTYLLENWHGQTSADVWIEEQLDLLETYKVLTWFGEGGVIRKAVEPFLKKRMTERRQYVNMEWMNPIHNKVISSRSFQARASQGKIYIPNGPMGDRCIEQLIKFPQGKYDDFCDTCAMIGRALDETYKAVLPISHNNDKVNKWDKAFNDDDNDNNWKTV